MEYRKLWIALIAVLVVSFLVLGGAGYQGIKTAPPIPQRVVTTDGALLFDGTTIQDGQNVWQSLGGQEIGSIFGHGAYLAPDWTADYLHRECTIILGRMAARQPSMPPAALQAELKTAMRTNSYDPATKTLTISPDRATAFEQLTAYYADVFGNGRKEFAIPRGASCPIASPRW